MDCPVCKSGEVQPAPQEEGRPAVKAVLHRCNDCGVYVLEGTRDSVFDFDEAKQ